MALDIPVRNRLGSGDSCPITTKSPCECELYRGPIFIEQYAITNGWHFYAGHLLTFKTNYMENNNLGQAMLKLLGNDTPVLPKEKDYGSMMASLRELDNLLPEGTRPWEVAQIALEFTDYIVRAENVTDISQGWMTSPEHEKASIFTRFLKEVYGKHQSEPLDPEDH